MMPMLVALFAAPTYHMLLAKTKSSTAIFIAAVLPSIILVATGHIPIAPLVSIPAGIIALLITKNDNYEVILVVRAVNTAQPPVLILRSDVA